MSIDIYEIERNLRGKKYKYLGKGSSRRVFDMRNGYVLKVAINEAGIAQNKAEYHIYHSDETGIFAEVIDELKEYKYLIMKKARKIKEFKSVLKYFGVSNKDSLKNLDVIKNIISRYDLVWKEFKKETSWGIVDEKVVIIDYGFTNDIKHKYY